MTSRRRGKGLPPVPLVAAAALAAAAVVAAAAAAAAVVAAADAAADVVAAAAVVAAANAAAAAAAAAASAAAAAAGVWDCSCAFDESHAVARSSRCRPSPGIAAWGWEGAKREGLGLGGFKPQILSTGAHNPQLWAGVLRSSCLQDCGAPLDLAAPFRDGGQPCVCMRVPPLLPSPYLWRLFGAGAYLRISLVCTKSAWCLSLPFFAVTILFLAAQSHPW